MTLLLLALAFATASAVYHNPYLDQYRDPFRDIRIGHAPQPNILAGVRSDPKPSQPSIGTSTRRDPAEEIHRPPPTSSPPLQAPRNQPSASQLRDWTTNFNGGGGAVYVPPYVPLSPAGATVGISTKQLGNVLSKGVEGAIKGATEGYISGFSKGGPAKAASSAIRHAAVGFAEGAIHGAAEGDGDGGH
jgi:hypothetical protein